MDNSYANDWTQTDSIDGKIVLAWSYMENYPYVTETTQFMSDLSDDLGCVKGVAFGVGVNTCPSGTNVIKPNYHKIFQKIRAQWFRRKVTKQRYP